MEKNKIYHGNTLDILKTFDDNSIDCCITSPPYWALRDYEVDSQLGHEPTPDEYVNNITSVFNEVKRVLKKEGTLWLNIGDTYCGTGHKNNKVDKKYPKGRTGQSIAINNKIDGLKSKDLVGIPWKVAFALQQSGWYLRSDIIWQKPNVMPESVKDRPTKQHEYIFLLSKSPKYYYDYQSILEPLSEDSSDRYKYSFGGKKNIHLKNTDNPRAVVGERKITKGRNKRTVWTVNTKPFKGQHFAVYPEQLIVPCVLAGCPKGGIVLDPFFGSGTTGIVALKNERNYIGIELNEEYIKIQNDRLNQLQLTLFNKGIEDKGE